VKKVDWEEMLSPNIAQKWFEIVNNSQELSKLKLPRWIDVFSSRKLDCMAFATPHLTHWPPSSFAGIFLQMDKSSINLCVPKQR